MTEPKTVDILIKFGLEASAAKAAAKQLDDVANKGKDTNNKLKEGSKDANAFGNALESAAKAAAGFLTVGKVLSEIGQAVNAYVGQAGQSEAASRKWLKATEDIQNAQVDIGRVLTSSVLPYYEAIAKKAKEVADYAEKQKAGYDTQFNNQTDAGQRRDPTLAGKDLIERPLTTVASLFGGAYNTDFFDTFKKLGAIIGNPGIALRANGGIPGLLNAFNNNSAGYNANGYKIPESGSAGPVMGTPLSASAQAANSKPQDSMTFEIAQRIQQRNKAEAEAQRAADYTKMKMLRDYNIQEQYSIADFNKSKRRAQRDFNLQETYAQRDFDRQRMIAARDFGIQMVRSEQDFQRSRTRASQDHEFDLYQIALSGDAMSYWLSERSFNIQQQRQKEDFEIQKSRSSEDFNRTLADQAYEFQVQRERALAAFNVRMADQEEDYKIQRDRAKAAYDLQLRDLNYSLSEQKRLRDDAIRTEYMAQRDREEALQALKDQFTQVEIDNYYNLMSDGMNQITSLIDEARRKNGLDPTRGYAIGGYTQPGPAMLHAGEFVMTAQTTAAAEQVAKGNLSQNTILQLLAHGGRDGATVNQVINSDVSADTRRTMMDDARAMLLEVM